MDDSISHGSFLASDASTPSPLYTPLDTTKQQIRLIEITSVNPRIVIKLHIVSLLDYPSFNAVSYVWGSQDGNHEDIIVNDTSIHVTKNLANALYDVHLQWDHDDSQPPTSTRVLWADAICINQKDPIEKSHQIPLMKKIYAGAEQVFAWVGRDPQPGSPESFENAFHVLEMLNRELLLQEGGELEHGNLQWMSRELADIFDFKDLFLPSSSSHGLFGVAMFMEQRYWARVWIFQEMFLARSLLFISGSKSIPYESFRRAINWLRSLIIYSEAQPSTLYYGTLEALRIVDQNCQIFHRIDKARVASQRVEQLALNAHGKHLKNLRVELHGILLSILVVDGFEASDPRDYVYGLLGISGLEIQPNYGGPWIETFNRPSLELLDLWRECDEDYLSMSDRNSWGLIDLWFLPFSIADSPDIPIPIDTSGGITRWTPLFRPCLKTRFKGSNGSYPRSRCGLMPAFCNIFDGPCPRWSINDAGHLECSGVMIDRVAECGPKGEDPTQELAAWVIEKLIERPFSVTPEGIRQYSTTPLQRALLNSEDLSVLSKAHTDCDVSQLFGLLSLGCHRSEEVLDRMQVLFQALCAHHHEDELETLFGSLFRGDFDVVTDDSSLPNTFSRRLKLLDKKDDFSRHRRHQAQWEKALAMAWGPRMGVTKAGQFGRFPLFTEVDDEIWLLKGYDRPVILRKVEGHNIFVGSAYIVEPLRGRTMEEIDGLRRAISRVEIF